MCKENVKYCIGEKHADTKERLKAIFEGQKVDRPACICPGGMMNMITTDLMDQIQVFLLEAHHDARQMAELAKAVYEQGCFEKTMAFHFV